MNALLKIRVLINDGPGYAATAGAAFCSKQWETSNDFETDSDGRMRVVL